LNFSLPWKALFPNGVPTTTTKPTVTCKGYDVVVVPFPFTDRRTSKRRPALALSSEQFSVQSGHTVLAMITSAKNPPWPMDVAIDATHAGLQAPSKVRMKLFTLDNRLILRKVGSLSPADRPVIAAAVKKLLGT
jgi:mRNA interferase MazF